MGRQKGEKIPANMMPAANTGEDGKEYEVNVVVYFVFLMVLGAISAVANPKMRINRMVIQNKKGLDEKQNKELPFKTDDLLLYCSDGENESKILISIKKYISFTASGVSDVIQDAYSDFLSPDFNQDNDRIALATVVLDGNKDGIIKIVDRAKCFGSYERAFPETSLSGRDKKALGVINDSLKGTGATKDDIFRFIRCFDIIILDLRGEIGIDSYSSSLASVLSLIEERKRKECNLKPIDIWEKAFFMISRLDGFAAVITRNEMPLKLEELFDDAFGKVQNEDSSEKNRKSIASNNIEPDDLSLLLLGRVNSDNDGDIELFANLKEVIDE